MTITEINYSSDRLIKYFYPFKQVYVLDFDKSYLLSTQTFKMFSNSSEMKVIKIK